MARILGGFLLAAALGTLLAALAARFKRVEELARAARTGDENGAGRVVRHSGADLVRLAQPVRVHRAGDGVPGDLHQRAGGRPRARIGSLAGDGARVPDSGSFGASAASTLPQVAPYFRAGCALGLGLCWKAGVAAEVIGMPVPSIGERLQQAKVYLDTPELFAWTLVIVLISVGFEKLFMAALGALERRLTRL